ncbi:hypothetical protein ANCCAN_27945 [Ancylostoma caninum]|uniref:Uncharacterized protein n=1 Tax=Ancylostoma caninum TaxID=29170 RepID=A0A368F5P3_ANCCA|nr:hypothetical protein ANCCAN_27945 [Ancylostoma caninum]
MKHLSRSGATPPCTWQFCRFGQFLSLLLSHLLLSIKIQLTFSKQEMVCSKLTEACLNCMALINL